MPLARILVRLPGPGKTFTSVVGVDTNAGGGSIIFSVAVGGKESFRSEVMHCGQRGVPVSVDLAGASEFTIAVDDAGDGISSDHANWADAKATLADGREVWLSELPVLAPEPRRRQTTVPPFSFVYGGQVSDDLLRVWKFQETIDTPDAHRTRRTQTYTDPNTGLVVRCVAVEYRDYPTVEWTLFFKNTGPADTPILEDIQALDLHVRSGNGTGSDQDDRCLSQFSEQRSRGGCLLHHHVGSPATARDFAPWKRRWARGLTSGSAPRAAGRRTATCPTSTWSGAAEG